MVIVRIIHDYTVDASCGKWEVKVSPTTGFGWFKHRTIGWEGTLKFKNGVLVDYAGRALLPYDVEAGLKAAGFVIALQ